MHHWIGEVDGHGLAPDGSHIALAFTQYGPYELSTGNRDTERASRGCTCRGSGTHPGGGVIAAPARNASRVTLSDVRRERLRTRLPRR
jgi:phytoene dehydrogenase-like protein